MQNPLISICCNTYNHEKYIRQCLDGFVMQQTTFSFEILVHDDASTDNTATIVKEYEQKFPYLFRCVYQIENQFSKQNTLVNILLEMTSSKYIAICEGDDYWTDPLKLQKQVAFLDHNPKYVMSFHSANLVLENLPTTKSAFPSPGRSTFKMVQLLKKHQIITNSLVFLRSALPNPLPKWFSSSRIGDIPLELLIAEKGLTYYHNESMSIYRIHSASLTHDKSHREKGRSTFLFVYKNLNKEFKYRYWPYFLFMILKTYLGYIKDIMGLNKSLK